MSLQYKFFRIPVISIDAWEEELNRFLRSVKVVHVQREFIDRGENSFWTLAIEYISTESGSWSGLESHKKERTDYKNLLSSEDFSIYVKLREWRKNIASQEGVPVYVIFTNEQMAKIAEKRVLTLDDLGKIDGVGESRVSKYGRDVIRVVSDTIREQEYKSEQ